jgi:FAD synthetase
MKASSGQLNPKVRIMVFGTFDIIHPGHRNFFKQAKALAKNSYLIVSLGRDKNVLKIKKHFPDNNQAVRLENIAQIPEVDEAVLGGLKDHLPHIIKAKPDIIALGYDQTAYVKNLKQELRASGLTTKIVRLKPYKPHIYKTSIIKSK